LSNSSDGTNSIRRKTQKQLQDELDEIQLLISQGLTDTQIIESCKIAPRTFYYYKSKLHDRSASILREKTIEDLAFDMDILRDRFLRDRVNAERQAQTKGANPNWQIIATQIAIDLFKLECEGLTAVHNHQMLAQLRDNKNNNNNRLLAE
jgi:hypothetical protein